MCMTGGELSPTHVCVWVRGCIYQFYITYIVIYEPVIHMYNIDIHTQTHTLTIGMTTQKIHFVGKCFLFCFL